MEMTIIEGLKRLRLLDKRMAKNCEEIQKYSSLLSNERPIFDSESSQREEVRKLIQANSDLEREYCSIKSRIDYTNLMTYVQIDDENRTIHSWLTVLRKTGQLLIKTYQSLSTHQGYKSQMQYRDKDSQIPSVIRLYDENDKRAGQRKWEDLTTGKTIEGRLEVVNATTELLMPPK